MHPHHAIAFAGEIVRLKSRRHFLPQIAPVPALSLEDLDRAVGGDPDPVQGVADRLVGHLQQPQGATGLFAEDMPAGRAIDPLAGELPDRPAQQHGLPVALPDRQIGAQAEQVLLAGADQGFRAPRPTPSKTSP